MIICEENECFGCSLCYSICPKKAITITTSRGFYSPVVNNELCVKCNICKSTCPGNKTIKLQHIDDKQTCYAAYSKNNETHYECSSGGLATEISKSFISNGGFVVGAEWNNNEVQHVICENIDELVKLSKSKYVQSNLQHIYKNIEKEIENKDCLFIGVPCQVNAIKEYFKNSINKDKLFYIDLLCRGGSSPLCFQEHVNNVKKNRDINNISFRGGEYNCNLVLFDKNNKIIYKGQQYIDPYFKMFMAHTIFNRKCYKCPFAGVERVGDITLGDFWGLDINFKKDEQKKGINMVLVNNKKGNELIDLVKDRIELFPRKAREAIKGNETLQISTPKPKEYDVLWERIHCDGFIKGLDYYQKNYYKGLIIKSKVRYLKQDIKNIIKIILPSQIINIVKRLKRG